LRFMKRMKSKKKKQSFSEKKAERQKDGKHSFLFWLVVPIVMVWLSIGYITGFVRDKPIWFRNENVSKESTTVVPYFQEHGSFSENLNQPFITFWFDDAWLSQYLEAYPVLKNNNFTGTIAVPVNSVETPNYMNWAQLRILQKDGWEITDHSLSHDCNMQNWDSEKVAYEYRISKLILWKNNLSADIFVTPCGVDGNIMRQEAMKTFLGYRTVDPGFNKPSDFNFYNLKVKNINDTVSIDDVKSWIDLTKESKSWLILVFHKVGEKNGDLGEEKFNLSKDDFENIVAYIRSSNIKVVLPGQIMSSQNL